MQSTVSVPIEYHNWLDTMINGVNAMLKKKDTFPVKMPILRAKKGQDFNATTS